MRGPSPQERILTAELRMRILDVAVAHGYRPVPGYRESLSGQLHDSTELTSSHDSAMTREVKIAVYTARGRLHADRRLSGRPSTRALPLPGNEAVSVGKYPVTVQEFARFVRTGAYEDLRWSRDHRGVYYAYGWHAPLAWDEQKRIPNAPVVGVSWHEAVAYCRWLTEEEHMHVRLPTQEEWRNAAGDLQKTNDIQRGAPIAGVMPILPVGISPELCGPGGHEDLGLMWEWLESRSGGPWQPKRGLLRTIDDKKHPVSKRRLLMSMDDKKTPVWRSRKGAMRSLIVGFRIVLEQPR
jgi:Sulfatase-modifying factor enzyme 1